MVEEEQSGDATIVRRRHQHGGTSYVKEQASWAATETHECYMRSQVTMPQVAEGHMKLLGHPWAITHTHMHRTRCCDRQPRDIASRHGTRRHVRTRMQRGGCISPRGEGAQGRAWSRMGIGLEAMMGRGEVYPMTLGQCQCSSRRRAGI